MAHTFNHIYRVNVKTTTGLLFSVSGANKAAKYGCLLISTRRPKLFRLGVPGSQCS